MKTITNLLSEPRHIPGDPDLNIEGKGTQSCTDAQIQSFGIFLDRMVKNGWLTVTDSKDKEPEVVEQKAAEMKHKGGGKWVVTVGGIQVHDELLKKAEALKLMEQYDA